MSSQEFWLLNKPIDTFFFDCDGTLSTIEGIDVLAEMNCVSEVVQEITARCMGTTGMTYKDYKARLDYVKPSKEQIQELGQLYINHCSVGAKEVIQTLLALNKKVYILSAGIKAAVTIFAEYLGLSADKVLAVDVYCDVKGQYCGFNEDSNLIQPHGKTKEIAATNSGRSVLVGDGMSDWEAYVAVSRFIGYAGLQPKSKVRDKSQIFITDASLFATIPLTLTQEEVGQLHAPYLGYYQTGLEDIRADKVQFEEC